jgi:hypothetical protein
MSISLPYDASEATEGGMPGLRGLRGLRRERHLACHECRPLLLDLFNTHSISIYFTVFRENTYVLGFPLPLLSVPFSL